MVTGFIAIAFLYQLAELVEILSSNIGIAEEDYAMKLALFHTLFNLIGILAVAPFTSRLVVFLESIFVVTKKDISRARYLDEAVVEVPEVAILALKKEIVHLYDNATEALSHALSLHRHTFIGMGDEISKVVESSVTMIDMNIDEFYERKIKALYGDIFKYATISQEAMSEEDKDKVYSLKIACREIVETIKDVKELQKNLNKFRANKNTHLQSEYNNLREGIAKTLDSIHTLRNTTHDDFDNLAQIKLMEENIIEQDMLKNGRIDHLIRNNLIETKIATSLINDSGFAYDVSKKLLNVATLLWIEDRQIQELGEE